MARIELHTDGPLARRIKINDVDVSMETFADGIELVSVGEAPHAEVGLRLSFAVSELTLNGSPIELRGQLDDAQAKLGEFLKRNPEVSA